MAILTRSAFARLAKVSPAAVSLAVKSGALVAEPDGGIDRAVWRNRYWLDCHRKGADTRGRLWRWPAGAGGFDLAAFLAQPPAVAVDDADPHRTPGPARGRRTCV